jgi:hypothetical protein
LEELTANHQKALQRVTQSAAAAAETVNQQLRDAAETAERVNQQLRRDAAGTAQREAGEAMAAAQSAAATAAQKLAAAEKLAAVNQQKLAAAEKLAAVNQQALQDAAQKAQHDALKEAAGPQKTAVLDPDGAQPPAPNAALAAAVEQVAKNFGITWVLWVVGQDGMILKEKCRVSAELCRILAAAKLTVPGHTVELTFATSQHMAPVLLGFLVRKLSCTLVEAALLIMNPEFVKSLDIFRTVRSLAVLS